MLRREFICGAVCAPLITSSAAAKAQGPTLVAHGGRDLNRRFLRDLRNAAGGKNFRLLLAPYSSKNPSKKAGEEIDRLRGLGYSDIEALNLSSFGAARSQIRTADAIWFAGGSQRRQVETIGRVPGVLEELNVAYSNGVVMAGSSAGAAVMSSLMITGGRKGSVKTQRGLGFWRNVVLDQLVNTRDREYRLQEVISANRGLLGLGLDEGVWITYSNGIATVGGRGKARLVYWANGLQQMELKRGSKLKLPT
ncbi:MAG: cyanophycinase [Litoreibacter sp.]|nr:cyanophycinase [Litoreibacter sp.]